MLSAADKLLADSTSYAIWQLNNNSYELNYYSINDTALKDSVNGVKKKLPLESDVLKQKITDENGSLILEYQIKRKNGIIKDLERKLQSSTIYECKDMTTIGALQYLVDTYNIIPAGLNMANPLKPGGAQEGTLWNPDTLDYTTNYIASLNKFIKNGNYVENTLYTRINPPTYTTILDAHGTIYSPNVLINQNNKKYTVALVAVAGLDLRTKQFTADQTHLWEFIIKALLQTMYDNGHKYIVLGAIGCGVFRNDPTCIAGHFYNLLQNEFKNKFHHVIFAIPNTIPNTMSNNYIKFDKMVQLLNGNNTYEFHSKCPHFPLGNPNPRTNEQIARDAIAQAYNDCAINKYTDIVDFNKGSNALKFSLPSKEFLQYDNKSKASSAVMPIYIINNVPYIYFGINAASGNLDTFGGELDWKGRHNSPINENFVQGAHRELYEESLETFFSFGIDKNLHNSILNSSENTIGIVLGTSDVMKINKSEPLWNLAVFITLLMHPGLNSDGTDPILLHFNYQNNNNKDIMTKKHRISGYNENNNMVKIKLVDYLNVMKTCKKGCNDVWLMDDNKIRYKLRDAIANTFNSTSRHHYKERIALRYITIFESILDTLQQ